MGRKPQLNIHSTQPKTKKFIKPRNNLGGPNKSKQTFNNPTGSSTPRQPQKEDYRHQGNITQVKRDTNTIVGNRSSAYTHNHRCQVRKNINLGVTQHSRTEIPRLQIKIARMTRNQPRDERGTMDIRRLTGTTPSRQDGTTAVTTTTNQTHRVD